MGAKNAPRKCPLCAASFGQDRGLKTHLSKAHSDDRPLDEVYVAVMLDNTWPLCLCGCGARLEFNKWNSPFASVVSGHNAAKTAMVAAHGIGRAEEMLEKKRVALRGKEGWSRGLSKETDERIAHRALRQSEALTDYYATHDHWSKGKRKETDERIAKRAEEQRAAYASGRRKAWHAGLTAETDDRVRQKRDDLIARYDAGEIVPWAKGLTSETDERVRRSAVARDFGKHARAKQFTPDEIRDQLASNKRLEFIGDLTADYVNANAATLTFKCVDCGRETMKSLATARLDRCPSCDAGKSNIERELYEFVMTLEPDAVCNDTKTIRPFELDVNVPSKSVAIEMHGLYYHSTWVLGAAAKTKHEQKRHACSSHGIRLIQLFEDEWLDKRAICESMMSHALGHSSKTIGARKCHVKHITTKTAREFHNRTHIENGTNATKAFGLFFDDRLVGCLTLRRPFHKTHAKNALEIARLSFELDTHVQGGVSRLVNAAAAWAKSQGKTRLMTYVDTRFGPGTGYAAAGMHVIDMSDEPRFWWTDGHKRVNRFTVRADKTAGITEKQVAERAGVTRIYGCKNITYSMAL